MSIGKQSTLYWSIKDRGVHYMISDVKFAENQDNIYVISKYFQFEHIGVCFFSYYHPVFSLHILLHIDTLKFTYINI